MNTIKYIVTAGLFFLLVFVCQMLNARERIAILSFELNDITSLPNTPAEQARTATIKPLLEQAIKQVGEYEIIHINQHQQNTENAGLGYLLRFHDVAARLGKKFAADWIIVGQHSKPSFLFSYLMVHVVNVQTLQLQARIDIEMKGNHQKVTNRGVKKVSEEIDRVISATLNDSN